MHEWAEASRRRLRSRLGWVYFRGKHLVERFFRDICQQRIKRGSFASVAELQWAINLYVARHNANPKSFIWTTSAS